MMGPYPAEERLLAWLQPDAGFTVETLAEMAAAALYSAHDRRILPDKFSTLLTTYTDIVKLAATVDVMFHVVDVLESSGRSPELIYEALKGPSKVKFLALKEQLRVQFDAIIQCPKQGDTKN